MGKSDELLKGAIDMHCHGFPEFSLDAPNRFSDEETVRMMQDAGMRGVVFKSHFYPTTTTAYYLNKKFPDFEIFGSITLNASSGGCNIWTLETAAKLGAKVAYMPTWSALNDRRRKSISKLLAGYIPHLDDFTEEESIRVCDEDGKVYKKFIEMLDFLKEKEMVLFTGHISPKESLALAKCAKEMGFKKLVFAHPDSGSVHASFEQIKAMAELGAYVEICALGLTPVYYRISIQEMEKIIHTIGAAQCIFTTDYFFEWSSPVPEQLRQMIGALLIAGVKEDEIKRMASENPAALLGLA